jgi:1,4-alpha-glucan branching enzyme
MKIAIDRQSRPEMPHPAEVGAIVSGRHGDPFSILGPHRSEDGATGIAAFAPDADEIEVIDASSGTAVAHLDRMHPAGFFYGNFRHDFVEGYRLRKHRGSHMWEAPDPYAFGSTLGDIDIYLLGEGTHLRAYERLGAHAVTVAGISGVRFAVWAPNASRVSVIGQFNGWDGRRHPMRKHPGAGVWDLFIPGLVPGDLYKYELLDAGGDLLPLKCDPVGQSQECPPATASRVPQSAPLSWHDEQWMQRRQDAQALSSPISIYEVHLGSWRRGDHDTFLDYDRIGDDLIPYVKDLGFTHVEFLPVSEFPFGGSWGYQPTGLFAPTARFGSPEAFARLIDRLHEAEIGVILDWVPGHFPSDAHGLARFDGTALYEHEDPRRGLHKDWNTLIYNYGRREVANFLEANAHYWLDRFHIDGLRVDAVASMLYLDYSRQPGEWEPNRYGGRENLEAIDFLRRMNTTVYRDHPGIITIAEESTAWPQVSRPVDGGGLGFGYKWNMGWMHDTLKYIEQDPIHRRYHHDKLTFGLLYAWDENFILPISHDEVVHGKGSLLGKMPGDRWQRFANMRAYLGFMWAHPGKKLLFMGSEFAQEREWAHDHSLDWHLLADPAHRGMQNLVRDLNEVYRTQPAMHRLDCSPDGFEWIDGGNANDSVVAFLRKGDGENAPALVVCNFTPVVRQDYRVGVPQPGMWHEILNTDASAYGGSNVLNEPRQADSIPAHGRAHSLAINLPPLAVCIFTPRGSQ